MRGCCEDQEKYVQQVEAQQSVVQMVIFAFETRFTFI